MRSVWLTCGPIVLSLVALTAHAEPVTFTETLTGGGLLGSSFTNQLITITGVGDTSNIQFASGEYTLDLSTVTVQAGSGPLDTFTGNIEAFVSDDGYIAGFEQLTPRNVNVAAVSGFSSDPFAGFTLDSSFSATGVTNVPSSTNFSTTGGSLVFETFSTYSTFSAVVTPAATPEPSSLVLLATGLLGVGETVRRKYRSA